MVVTQLILALVLGCFVLGLYMACILAADIKAKSRILKHNVNHALTPIMLEIDRINAGMADDAEKAALLLKAMRAWLHPIGEQEIPLKAFCKPLVASYQMIQFYPLADPIVSVDVGELYSVMINCVQNAMEGREAALVDMSSDQVSEAVITIRLDNDSLQISNPARPEDRSQILNPTGSTRGSGRGNGMRSIRDSCARIGWSVGWEVSGSRVVTTLSFA
jgi:hypothetical protein